MDDIGQLNCPYCGEPFGSHVTTEFGSPRCRLVGGADGRQPNDERGEVDHGTRDEPLCPVCHLPASEHDPDYLCARYLPEGAIAHWRRDAPAVPDAALDPAPAPLGFATSVRSAAAAEAMGLVVSEMERLTVALRESEAEIDRLKAIGVASAPGTAIDAGARPPKFPPIATGSTDAGGRVVPASDVDVLLAASAVISELEAELADRDARLVAARGDLDHVLATTGATIAGLRAEVVGLKGASPAPPDPGAAGGPVARHVVAVVVEDREAGMVLLLRRSSACTWPGTWSFVGGHVEPGETPELACGRELAEETGLTADRFEPAGTTETPARWPADAMIGHVFRAVGVGGTAANREPHRRDRMEWFSWDRLPGPLHPGTAQWIAEHGTGGHAGDRSKPHGS